MLSIETSIIHITGLGGAGKSTVGELLAENLAIPFLDLDQHFLQKQGHIESFIAKHSYITYAQENLRNYQEIIAAQNEPIVVSLSSGFMTYPSEVKLNYKEIISEIENHPLSILLLPSFEIEECVDIIVSRQLSRPYLLADKVTEEIKARNRFPLLMSLKCRRFQSNIHPNILAEQLTQFVVDNASFQFKQEK